MNDQFKEHAIDIIDNMSTEELKTGLKDAGIEVIEKSLSQIPVKLICKGMFVKGGDGTEGKIVSVNIESSEVAIQWTDGRYAEMELDRFTEVTLFSEHSGKRLIELAFADIFVGMDVISAISTPGKIARLLLRQPHEDDNTIAIDWDNEKHSRDYHYNFREVKVK